ncbi:leucine-rich repeat protein, partial [Akkermansiaceae bacterium]|nr:leucine-rich repeat protein [Akkermansiaceae bacterium]
MNTKNSFVLFYLLISILCFSAQAHEQELNLTETDSILVVKGDANLIGGPHGPPLTFQEQTLTGSYGAVKIFQDGTYDYVSNAAHDVLAEGAKYSEVFAFMTVDDIEWKLTVNITGTNDAPAISKLHYVLNATLNSNLDRASGILRIADVEANQSYFVEQVATENTYGLFSLKPNGAWEYTTKASHEGLLVGESISDSFTITAADGTPSNVSITVKGSKNPEATVVNGKSHYVVPETGSLTLRREVFKDGPNFTESDGWNNHRATVETLFKLEAGKRYSFKAQGISLGDAIMELAGPIAENTTYSVASQPEYGTVTVDQHTGSWLYTINQGVTQSRDYGGFELALTSDEVVAVPANSTLSSKKRTKVGTEASPSEYELKLVGKTITFKGSADGTLTGNGVSGAGFDADMSFQLKSDLAAGEAPYAVYDSSYPRLYLYVEEDGTSTIDQIVSAIGALNFFFDVKATTLLESGSVGLAGKAVAGGNVNNWIARNDSGDYMGKDAEIIITAKTTGYYLLRCFGGGNSGNYDIGDLDLIVTKVAADDFGGDRSLLPDVEANGDLVKPVSWREVWENQTIADGQVDGSIPAALAVNTSFKGNLANGDVDYVKVNLEIEKWYTFEVGGDLSDPKIDLVNADGGWVANGSEDGGVGLNGKVGFALSPGGANVAGDYYLVIQSGAPEYWGRERGDVSGEYVVKALSGVRGQFGHWLENKDSNILKGNLPENDVPVGIGTTIEPAVGTLFSGSIEIDADRDWYKFSLVKDKIYRWDLESISLVKGSIVLRDSTGETLIVHDKLTVGGDGAVETEGSIVHRAEYTGDYYVEVYSDENIDLENPNAATGTFNLSSTELSDDYGGYIISQGHPSYIPLSYDFNEAGYLQAGSRVYSDFYSGIEKYPKDINGNQINLSGNPRGDFDFFGVDLFSSNTYSFATYETEAAVRVGNNSGNYSAITLYDSLGNKVEGGDSVDGFSFTPVTDGYYYLGASSYNGPGGYMITSSFYGDDYSSNSNTRGRVFLGESVAGELETTGDDDWIRADLQIGKRYKFEHDQAPNRQFELYGPGELNNVDVQRALGWGGVIEDGFSKPDIGQDAATARAIANALGDVNGGVKAHITFGDKDWYKLTFEEGSVYQINLVGMPVYLKPALPDPMLTLFDPNGEFIKLGNNNAGVNAAHSGVPGKDSELVYTATESGTFYVEVKAETNRPMGDFTANGPAVSGATTITVDKIGVVLSPGDVLVFSSDAKFTVGVLATVNSTTLTGQLVGAIADDETAYLGDLVMSESALDGATSLVLLNPIKRKFKVGEVFEFANNATFTVDTETEDGVSTLSGVLDGNVEAGDTAYFVGVGGYGLISTQLPVDKIATDYADIIDWTPQYSAPYYVKFGSWFGEIGEYLVSMSSLPELSANDVVGSSREDAVAFALGDSVTTTIDYGGDLDWFQFEMLAGETYAIEVQGTGVGPSSQISIRDRFGKAVEGWDYGDYYGSNEELGIDLEDSKIFYYSTPLYHLDPDTLPRTYYVQIGANIAGDVTFKVTHLFDDQKESPLTTGVLNVGDTASGTWENGVENGANIELIHGTGGGDGDWFKTQLIAGNTYKIDVFTDPANRPSMYIFAEDGTLLTPEDEVETIKDGHAQLTYTANRTGDFFIDPINTKSWGGNNIYDLSLVYIADDVASSIKTSATLAVGGETNGNLERVNDRDWFKVNLKRGHVYKFDLSGASLKNPTLRIRDSHGNQLLYNDQINGWWDPSITYTATEDGVYYVDTAGIDSGQFTMKCTNTYSPPEGSNFFIGKAVELKTDQQTDSVNAAVAHTIGNIVQGEIVLPNDRRWYKVQLKKSRAYEFHLFGDSMQSPSLYLRDHQGAPVFPCPKLDKERSSGEKLVLQYTAPEDAEYILDAGGFWSHVNGLNTGVATGTFSLQTFDLGLNSYRAVTWDTNFADAVANEGLSVLGVGNSVSDSIVNAANRDLYKVSLIEGASYKFRIDGQLVNAEIDLGVQPRLFLHSSEGTLVVTETNNSLEYKATETGDFYIAVGATTGQPSGLDFRFNSAVPYSYNLKAIQSRARKTEPTANWYAALKDTGISSLVNAGISDNSLSRNEVLEILESVKDGGVVDADELNDLRVLVANHKEVVLSNYVATVLDNIANGDPANQYYTGRDGLDGRTSRAELGNLYPGSSSDRLTKLISKWFLGTDSPATSTQYARLDLPLYFNGAGTEDPRQGSVGDCYLIAAMSAIADTSIGSIDGTVPSVNPGDMIVDNGDGTYGVRFYDNDGAERWVTVDKFVPGHREDNLLFAGTNSGESWAMLVEKAYVQLNESDNISQDGTNRYGIGNAFGIAGGDSGQALSHLTGQKASYGFIDSEPGNEWTADKLRALLDQDLPLVFSTGAPCALASSYNVKRRHAYTYESYDPQTQKFYLRNAWGFEHAYVTFEGLQVMGSNIAYLDGTKTKMERIDANSTFSAAFGAYGDDEESEAGLTAVESFGSVTLYTDTNNRLYAGSVAQGIKPVRINGQLATLSLNERTAIAAESIGGINQILWRDNYSQALIKMNFDSSWQFLPTDNVVMVSGTPEFNAAELAFGEGGNVDNTAPVITVISGTNTDYTNTAIATDSSNSTLYDKSLHVNGLEIVQGAEISGQAAVPDLFTEKVAQVVKLMISRSGADIDDAAQENMVRTLKGEAGTWHATKPTAQRVLRGAGADYSPNPLVDSNYSSYSGLQSFQDTHSTKDMIWYLNSDAASGNGDADITEVVEHLMHTIHSYGVRGGVSGSIEGLSWMPDMDPDWKTRELFLALKQAVDNGVFSLGGYGDEDYNTASTFELAAIEYLYLLNFNMWGYSTLWDGGSLAPEWNDNSRTPSGIETNNPLGYALYNKYIKPVLARPSLSALRNIFQDGDIGDPAQAGLSGYTPGNGIVTDTVERGSSWTDAGATADTGETVTASGTVDTNIAGTYTITYNSTDEAGNVGTATRTVTVVEPEPAQFVTLTVNQPSGGFIDYTAIHEKGATATITAIANSTNFFDGWSGDGSFAPLNADGSKAALLMDGDKTITAIFSARRSPVITSGATGMDLLENSGLGSTVYTITASSDSGGLSYAIAGADASLLSVNSASGVVSLTANPDYETKSSYSFNVTATDGLTSAPTEVTFSISNVDEVVPTITSGAIGINLAENSGPGQAVYTITAAANDGGTLLSYAIAGIDSASLSVDSQGVVSLNAVPDYETKNSYSFTVTSSDAAGTSLPTEVTFQITDVDETFVYTTNDGKVTITDCDETVAGELIIQSVIEGNPVTTIGDGGFSNCTSLTSITIPDSVTSIGAGAFNGCTSLTSITIPDSVTSIGASAFAACTGLTSITIGNSVTSIGDAVFNGCTSLTSITIPDSVTSIGTAAFGGCTGLTSITIGNSVTSIGDYAFNGCTSLTSITIPDSVTSIGASAFAACTSLTEIIFQGAAPTVGSGVFTGVAAGANALVVNESLSSFGENGDNWNGLALGTIFPPVITVTSGTDILELGSSWADAGATADGQEVVTSTGTVDTNTLGSYTITYTATGRAGNVGTATRTVTVVDTTAPVITLSGSAITTVEAGFPYNDAGATADGQEAVTSTGIVDINTVGNYSITYTATDASGNVGTATRTVIVEDTISPVITVTTGNDTVERGSSWTNAGATTTEGSISFTGSVNTDAVGTYTITYSATDSSNNTTTATRTVTVVSSGGEDSFGDVVVYPNNSTQLIGQVTIEGEVAESGDVVAIYVGNELRGKQEVITNGGVAWVNVLVNAAGGNETISFKVYDASTGVT